MPKPPSKPPRPDAQGQPPSPGSGARGSPVKAILTGLFVDLGGSVLVGVVLTQLYRVSLALSGLSADEIDKAMAAIPPQSMLMILAMVMGAGCSVAGGYVCARIVGRDEFRAGAVMASLSAFLSLLSGPVDVDADLLVLTTLSTIACVLLGVKYGRERNQRSVAPPEPPAGSAPR